METGEFWHLGEISDEGLRRGLSELCASGCRIEARVVAHLAEVERRRLYLRDGFSSLYKYCLVQLGLSQDAAFYRMTAARIGLRFPIVFELLEERRIHLSGLCLLRDFLTAENHLELLGAAEGKTKDQIREQLARRFPAARLADSIRKLPKRRIEPIVGPTPAATGPALGAREAEERGERPVAVQAQAEVQVEVEVEVVDPTTGEVTTVSSPSPTSARPGLRAGDGPNGSVQPTLHEVRYRVQFDASSELKAKIEQALALSSHANPKGDLGTLFERTLDLYLAQQQKNRFGKTEKPRSIALRTRAKKARVPGCSAKRKRAHIPSATRREVVDRDGLRCAYIGPSGRRCDEQAFLQLHHNQPWARQGDESASNLQIFCASHNRFMAEQDFGAEHVARRVEEVRAKASSAERLRAARSSP